MSLNGKFSFSLICKWLYVIAFSHCRGSDDPASCHELSDRV